MLYSAQSSVKLFFSYKSATLCPTTTMRMVTGMLQCVVVSIKVFSYSCIFNIFSVVTCSTRVFCMFGLSVHFVGSLFYINLLYFQKYLHILLDNSFARWTLAFSLAFQYENFNSPVWQKKIKTNSILVLKLLLISKGHPWLTCHFWVKESLLGTKWFMLLHFLSNSKGPICPVQQSFMSCVTFAHTFLFFSVNVTGNAWLLNINLNKICSVLNSDRW